MTKNKISSSLKAPEKANKNSSNDNVLVSFLETLPVGVLIFTNSKILFANKTALKIFRPSKNLKNQITSQSIFDFLLPEYHKRIKENSKRILNGEEFIPFELKIKNEKNQIIDLEIKSNVIIFNGKKAIQTVFTDVTERVKIREELANSKRNLDLITENANDLIFFYTYHPKPKYHFISSSSTKILGYTPEDFYKNPYLGNSIAIDKKGYKEFEVNLSKLQKSKSVKQISSQFQYKTKEGKVIWLEDSYSPIFDEKGNITSILGISRDITKEKETKLDLEQKWNNYKNLLDAAPIGIFIHNGICIYANKKASDILEEKDETKLIGKNLLNFLVPEQREIAKNRIEKIINGEFLQDTVYKIKTVKGNIIDIDLKAVPFMYNGKKVIQTTISNVATEKKLEDEKLKNKLAEKTNNILIKVINERNASQEKLNTIFNTSTHIIWTVDKEYKLSSFNQNYYDQLKHYYKKDVKPGADFKKIYHEILNDEEYDFWMDKYTQVFEGKNLVFETEKIQANGEKIFREVYLNPSVNHNGIITEVAAISHNITVRKLNEQKANEQSAKLNAIFESGNQLIWTVDKNFIFTSFNQNFSDAMFLVYGVRPTTEPIVYKPSKGKNSDEYHNWWISKYKEAFDSHKALEFTTEQTDRAGTKYYRQIFIQPIISNDGKIEEISCISHDITELKYLQTEAANQTLKIKAVFESTSHLIWTIGKNNELLSSNTNFNELFKLNYRVSPKIGFACHELITTDLEKKRYKEYWYVLYKKVFNGSKLKFEKIEIDKEGVESYREVHINPVRNHEGEIVEIACLAHDISENKKFEQQIIKQSAKLKAVFESGNQLMWTINKDYNLTSFNQNYSDAIYDLYEFYPELGKNIRKDNPKSLPFQTIWNEQYEKAFNGQRVEFTTDRTNTDGKQVYRQYYLYPIKNVENNVIEVSGLGFDVTENKRNEEKIIQSLKEKEILLKEVHHRVKNNMQVISSILNLQSSYVKDEYALNLLKECQNRIKSMAFIHESLYQTKNFESVNFSEYISTLTKNLVHTYTINSQKIKLILTLDDLFLNLDNSIPCGLIINEIISNSLKYAFPNNRDGIIFVTLKVDNKKILIEAGDNGIGISDKIDIKNTQTLGLQLVDTLIEQINGTINLERTNGTKFRIEFNL